MKRVGLSFAFLLLFSVSLVSVSAWADSEPASSAAVGSPDVDVSGAVGSPSVPLAEPIADSDAESAAASDSASEPTLEDVMREAEQLLAVEDDEPADSVYTIWDKPFDEYTPTEGYLFLLFVLALSVCIFKLFKGGIW